MMEASSKLCSQQRHRASAKRDMTCQLLLSAESFQQGDNVVMSQAAQHLDFAQGSLANNFIICSNACNS